jgi:phosphotriesterase-related protein
VWVHAQSEKDRQVHAELARAGVWVEFDGVGSQRLEEHVRAILEMIERGYLANLLVSQDSGWYRVGEPGGGEFNGYTFLFDSFLPALRKAGIGDAQVHALMTGNPARALTPVKV